MPFTTYLEKQVLDWQLGGAAATQPAGWWIQWATGSPNSVGASDGPYLNRQTVSFAAANSPQGSATNLNAITGTATAIATARGWNIYDASAGGNRLFFGTLSRTVNCASGDNPAFAAGALKIILS